MKIALAQTNIRWEDKISNIENAERWIAESKALSAEMIFFPEMSFTGFSMNIAHIGEHNRETVQQVRKLCCKYKMYIGFGWVGCGCSKAQNHYSVLDPEGNEISDYMKIHPFSFGQETKYFEGGDRISLFKIGKYTFSTFICYDLRFPEIFQIASKKAGVIVVPANWPKIRNEDWKILLKTRAIENQSYILGVNCVGNINSIEYDGCTMAINPEGKSITSLEKVEGVVCLDINDDVLKIRDRFPIKRDRKWDLYNRLINSL